MDASQAGEGQDALVLVMPAYYHNAGVYLAGNAMYGLVFFKMCLLKVYLNPSQKQEIQWQLGFMSLFRDSETMNFEAAKSPGSRLLLKVELQKYNKYQ